MERRRGLDLARALGAIGIIVFHFYCHSNSEHKLFLDHASGSWGGTLNFLFFTMSGYLLHMRYGAIEKLNVRGFYYRRWKSTIPAYLLVFSYMVLMNILSNGKIFYMPIPKRRMLLALTGIDSYLNWIIPTYSTVGEWFLGAILIAYAVYPILHFLYRKAKYLPLVGLLILCVFFAKVGFLGFPYANTPPVFLLSFYIGMLLSELPMESKNLRIIIPFFVCTTIFIVPMRPVPVVGTVPWEMISAIFLLLLIMEIGDRICKNERVFKGISQVSGLSYYTFLIHHSIIYKVLDGFNPTNTICACISLGVILVLTLLFSKVLDIVMKEIFRSESFRKWEEYMTS